MKFATIILVALLLAGAAVWSLTRQHPHAAPPAVAGAAHASTTADNADIRALEASPQARDYLQRRDFERRLKAFLAQAAGMGTVARSEQARALATKVADEERARRMSAGEAFALQAALIDAATPDQSARIDALARLAEHYRTDSAIREQAWRTQLRHDPRFRDYKTSERRIVNEVMAMTQIPGGLTRDAYLRQRLLRARERAYDP